MNVNTKDHPVFYINNSNACDKSGNINLQQSQSANTFTNSISRRRKLTQSLSGLSSPGQVRNKLSPVREYVPSTNSNAGSPTTPTNPLGQEGTDIPTNIENPSPAVDVSLPHSSS